MPLARPSAADVVSGVAAIGNAVFHATGKRIRELPMTADKLLG